MIEACEALADPIRAEIVERLAKGDLTAGEIAGGFAVSRPAVSRHLRVLRECGLVTYEADATKRRYRLNPRPMVELQQWIERNHRVWSARLDALGDHLDDMARKERKQR